MDVFGAALETRHGPAWGIQVLRTLIKAWVRIRPSEKRMGLYHPCVRTAMGLLFAQCAHSATFCMLADTGPW